jgi:hypothetical protein
MTEIRFAKPMEALPRLKQTVSVFSLEAPGVNESLIRKKVKQVKLKGFGGDGSFTRDEERLTYTEGQFVLSLHRASGALRYYDSRRWQIDDGRSKVQFSDEQAVSIAKRFLTQSELVSLAECTLLRVSHLQVGTLEHSTGRASERIIDAAVIFQRMVDNLPVLGPGGKVSVYIAHDGEVSGCNIIWRKIKGIHISIPVTELRTPKFAEEHLSKHWTKKGVPQIQVDETLFGYLELGPCDSQRFLQPVYMMPLTLSDPERKMAIRTVYVVPAAVKPIGRLVPPVKPPVEQPVRRD